MSNKHLMVPMHLDALFLAQTQTVVGPLWKFDKLPHNFSGQAVNTDRANLSSAIQSAPFRDRNHHLKPGVHLHWALPDALAQALHYPITRKRDFLETFGKRRGTDIWQQLFPNAVGAPWVDARTARLGDISGKTAFDLPAITRLVTRQSFPLVPDRWLVTRHQDFEIRGQRQKRWLVESDYLHPHYNGNGNGKGGRNRGNAIAYPLPEDGEPPFRYMGRQLALGSLDSLRSGTDAYLNSTGGRLTAVGYGEASFAAFYPNCQSVFGFHDPYSGDLGGIRYEVTGWYDDPANDYMRTFAEEFFQRPVAQSEHDRPKNLRLLEALASELNWLPEIIVEKAKILGAVDEDQLGDLIWQHLVDLSWLKPAHLREATSSDALIINPLSDGTRRPLDVNFRAHEAEIEQVFAASIEEQLPDRLTCYASMDFEAPDQRAISQTDRGVTVAVANSGVEAASSLVADLTVSFGKRRSQEEKLEAVQLSHKLDDLHHDVGPKFREARHDRGFLSAPGGSMWTIRLESPNDQPGNAEDAELALKDPLEGALAAKLNDVNMLQQRYETSLAMIESLRKQVFNDWTKYCTTNLATDNASQSFSVSSDEIRRRLETVDIPNLERQIHETGSVLFSGKTSNAPVAKLLAGNEPSLAHALVEALNALSQHVEDQNIKLANRANSRAANSDSTGSKGRFVLKQVEGPRYWVPKEPSVVIAGESTKPTPRHGQDGRLRSDGLLWCPIKSFDIGSPQTSEELIAFSEQSAGHMRSVHDAEMRDSDRVENFAFNTCRERPWHPFFMEWQAIYLPVLDPATQQNGARFSPRYLDAGFHLSEDKPFFEPANGNFPGLGAPVPLTGRTVLSGHTGTLLRDQLERRLTANIRSVMMKKFAGSRMPPEQEINDDKFLALAGEFTDWFEDALAGKEEIISGKLSTPDWGKTNRTAHEIVEAWVEENHKALLLWYVVADGTMQRYFSHRSVSAFELPADALTSFWTSKELEAFETWCTAEIQRLSSKLSKRLKSGGQQTDADVVETEKLRADLSGAHRANHVMPLMVSFWNLASLNILSQALSGFNHALLMKRLSHAWPVDDPLGFDDYQPFVDRVRDAVLDLTHEAPMPANDFHPLRAGALDIEALRLVDTFGQVRDLKINRQITSAELQVGARPKTIFMPPRIAQPARLNFRWLSAQDDRQEMNVHPASSPVCGWIMPNHLDESLLIYGADGRVLGSITGNPKNPWQPAPGSDDHVTVEAIPNRHMRRMVEQIVHRQVTGDGDHVANMLLVLEDALENIDPAGFAQHQARALLMGRPLALVRASLDLQIKGAAATNQRWSTYPYDSDPPYGDTRGFDDVEFPVRIGEHKQLNDGLAGYWVENKSGDWGAFYSPQADDPSFEEDGIIINNHRDGGSTDPFYIRQTLAGEPHIVNLLLDPRGVVHATSAILPTKALHLPPEQYSQALDSIEVTFLTAPVLTRADELNVSLPDEAGYAWSWLSREDGRWSEISTSGHIRFDAFAIEFSKDPAGDRYDPAGVWHELVELGWLTVANGADEADRAAITASEKRKSKLSEELSDLESLIEHVFAKTQIGDFDTEAHFTGKQEFREGWLKLRGTKENSDDSETPHVV